MTNSERAAALRDRRYRQGLRQLNVWLPQSMHEDFKRAIVLLQEAKGYIVAVTLQDADKL